jgi:hypothetical protein
MREEVEEEGNTKRNKDEGKKQPNPDAPTSCWIVSEKKLVSLT